MRHTGLYVLTLALAAGAVSAGYVNFESSHVHPLDLTPSGDRLLAVNTPDARLEVYLVQGDGSLVHEAAVPVGLEPVSVVARSDTEAWVVNNLSDSISIVDLAAGVTVETLPVGDEPTDVAFAGGKAFVAVSEEDAVLAYDLGDLTLAPLRIELFGRDVRALAVSPDATEVYAVVLKSGNRTTVVSGPIAHFNLDGEDPNRLTAMGLREMGCTATPPPYPPLPSGITRNPALTDPPDGVPKVGLIVSWNESNARWEDEAGSDWNPCLPYRLADKDLFVIDVATASVTDEVRHLGTTLFEVSVHPGGKIYVPNTDARNAVRFEHELGVQGHMVDNLLSVVDPGNANAVTRIDLNQHIDRASDPAANLAERVASISQPGMLVWNAAGSTGYLSAIGSRKVFRVDGACLAGSCIFGSNRAAPAALEVGEGPTGVALLEVPGGTDYLYVLNRISHSLTIVDATAWTVQESLSLHDPSSDNTRNGRRFLYDAIDSSGHGDAACSSCHISGDLDGLAWDLGDPEGAFADYDTADDNVRFITVGGGDCDPSGCAAHDGFDPQKGPMTTQTLRGMLEPLHWRGDRPTMNDFNAAFVGLMGKQDIGPVNGKPAGLTAQQMEMFRQFSLEIRFPPNPHREVDDTLPCAPRSVDPLCEVKPHGSLLPGNPGEGELLFFSPTSNTDGGGPCVACHTAPFGAAGGKLGGVTPEEPTSPDAAALFNGTLDGSLHSDLKVPHLRNMHEKFGPVWPAVGDNSMPETINGFGFTHDGAIPDMFRFLSAQVFSLSSANQAQEVRDIATFQFFFPSGTKPAVGRQLTVPQGTPPTGTTEEESLLATLTTLGDLGDVNRHCELFATTVSGGRLRAYHYSGGQWITDSTADPALSTTALREGAEAPVTFTCATLTAGPRLGGDRDEDTVLDGDDCAAADAETWAAPDTVDGLTVDGKTPTELTWTDQSGAVGPSLRHEVLGGTLSDLASVGPGGAACLDSGLASASYTDLRPDPAAGDGYYYLVRSVNPCGAGSLGPGRSALDALACP